ncbi:hypothetical protein [Solibacillus sp. FSL K6-1523]|uniref:hypothetical protein n=1 Tax=Solibacillus sp. FSL K6-1523 TaxID=2921471 RepID=UPI0030F712CE
MKKFFVLFLMMAMIIMLAACSNNASKTKLLSKEGVAPYELSESDAYLLQSLGLEMDANILSFKAPKTAKGLNVNAYVLNNDGTWEDIGGVGVSLGQDTGTDERLQGTFAMLLKENYAIDFNIHINGRFTSQTEALNVNFENMASLKGFLTDFRKIELNKEIPVALMVYDGGDSMRSYEMEDFFSPSIFEGMDLVQAVTLTFTDEID